MTYTRVKDKKTGHEFDIPVQRFNPDKHTRVNKKHYPDTGRPRPAKHNVKNRRNAEPTDDETPASS